MEDFYKGRMSLNKDAKSPFWMVTFQDAQGNNKRRSTKVPHAGGMFEGVNLTAKAAEKVAYKRAVQIACAHQHKLESENKVTVRQQLTKYLERKKAAISASSSRNTRVSFSIFLEFIGNKADQPLQNLSRETVKNFIAYRREQVRHETVRRDMTQICAAFADAVDSELISKNPCARLKIPADKAEEKIIKEAFTIAEIRHLMQYLTPEWQSAVNCCLGTFGQRLSDILRLGWSQFDWQNHTIRMKTKKTGRNLGQPMSADFYAWAAQKWTEAGQPESGLLHPNLRAIGSNASQEFTTLVKAAGIGTANKAEGNTRRKTVHSKTFHSLRATAATLLHAAGVSEGIAMHLVGQDSAEVHKVYIRPNQQQLAEAAAKLGTS